MCYPLMQQSPTFVAWWPSCGGRGVQGLTNGRLAHACAAQFTQAVGRHAGTAQLPQVELHTHVYAHMCQPTACVNQAAHTYVPAHHSCELNCVHVGAGLPLAWPGFE